MVQPPVLILIAVFAEEHLYGSVQLLIKMGGTKYCDAFEMQKYFIYIIFRLLLSS
jgi:hypothetical protein